MYNYYMYYARVNNQVSFEKTIGRNNVLSIWCSRSLLCSGGALLVTTDGREALSSGSGAAGDIPKHAHPPFENISRPAEEKSPRKGVYGIGEGVCSKNARIEYSSIFK